MVFNLQTKSFRLCGKNNFFLNWGGLLDAFGIKGRIPCWDHIPSLHFVTIPRADFLYLKKFGKNYLSVHKIHVFQLKQI